MSKGDERPAPQAAEPEPATTKECAVADLTTLPWADLPGLIERDKRRHFRESHFRMLKARNAERERRQPYKINRLRKVMDIVDHLEARGVLLAVGRDSVMNKTILDKLNEEAVKPSERITGDGVRRLLKEVRYLRELENHFIWMRPYRRDFD
jgi:hypothetical protein